MALSVKVALMVGVSVKLVVPDGKGLGVQLAEGVGESVRVWLAV